MTFADLEGSISLALMFAASIYGVMLLAAMCLMNLPAVQANRTPSTSRFGALDGLRGMLAAGVMVSHAFAAHQFMQTGVWAWSTNSVLNQLGQTTVAIFFMATAFLFTKKAFAPEVNWKALYLSRFARLFPLHTLVVLVVFTSVLSLSGGIAVPWPQLSREVLAWLLLGCFGLPDINGHPFTWTLIAGVNWTLKYEVYFYAFGVPIIWLLWKKFSIRTILICSILCLLALMTYRQWHATGLGASLYLLHFLCGVLTACLLEIPSVTDVIGGTRFRWIAGGASVGLLSLPDAGSPVAVLLTLAVFIAVLGGASMGGLLKTKAAIWLGDVSYGIYLMHGLAIWLAIFCLQTFHSHSELQLLPYWGLVLVFAMVVVLVSSLSYVSFEKPVMIRMRNAVSLV